MTAGPDPVLFEVQDLAVRRGAFCAGPIRFELRPGEILLLFGPSLSGKTTLIKALATLLGPPQAHIEGRARVGKYSVVPLEVKRLAEIRADLGVVFQNDALFDSLDALQNVALPLLRRHVPRPEAEARARAALGMVELGLAEHKLPEQLSGGMRKRLGLARALVVEPEVLLVDEPLAGLDPGTSSRIRDILTRPQPVARVIAAADPGPFWEHVHHAIALKAGSVVASGPPHRVRQEARSLLEAG